MDRGHVPAAAGGDRRRRHGRAPRRASPGLRLIERDGYWHVHGTLRAGGRRIRVRQSTGLPARPDHWEDADAVRRQIEQDLVGEIVHGRRPSQPLAVAADRYLNAPRRRPLGKTTAGVVKELNRAFGRRLLDEIRQDEWTRLVEARMAGRKSETRERWLNAIVGFLNWCRKKPRQWLVELPAFDRDALARNPRTRGRRRLPLIPPHLVALMIEHAAPHLAGQLAVEWSTGARVSSVLYRCRLADLVLAPDRAHITFPETKNGSDVTAALHPWAVEQLERYLKWRGRLQDREAPLFLTDRRQPYSPKGFVWGGQNKTAFAGMKRRAVKARRKQGADDARRIRRAERAAARELLAVARAEAALLAQVTQHWFRHNLATRLLMGGADLRSVMEQGGWVDADSVMVYAQDVAEHRRALVSALPAPQLPASKLTLARDRIR